MEEYDLAVVGLGVIGSAAAYYAASKGKKVVAFEQYELGHVRGASHDTSRIVRTSNSIPEYAKLAKSAYQDWARLEEAAGQRLLTITGGVIFIPRNEPNDFSNLQESLDVAQVPYELLKPVDARKRWPQFHIPDDTDTVYTADTGMAHASKTVSALQNLALHNGARIYEHTRVERIVPDDAQGGVTVDTSSTEPGKPHQKGRYRAKKVVLATDAWTNELLAPLGTRIPLTIMQEQVTYFQTGEGSMEEFERDRFPVWIWAGTPTFYGFPAFGEPTIKAARDVSDNFTTPSTRSYMPSTELLGQLSSFMAKLLPGKGLKELRTVTCQYTITPDREFVISPLEQFPDIIVGLGSAPAFKFAPTFGRVLAELAIDGKTDEDISRWGIPPGSDRIVPKL